MKIITCALAALLCNGAAWAGDFSDNLNGTVTDNLTGLTWQQQDDHTPRSWEAAIAYCENLSLASHEDWRLPNIRELGSLIDGSRANPAIDPTAFPNVSAAFFWSSTMLAGSASAWIVDFALGDTNFGSGSMLSRCVRGGQ